MKKQMIEFKQINYKLNSKLSPHSLAKNEVVTSNIMIDPYEITSISQEEYGPLSYEKQKMGTRVITKNGVTRLLMNKYDDISAELNKLGIVSTTCGSSS